MGESRKTAGASVMRQCGFYQGVFPHQLIFDRKCAIDGVTTYVGLRHRQSSREAAEDYRRGQASPGGASAAHVSSDLKVSLRLTVERSGTARCFNGHQSLSHYVFGDYWCGGNDGFWKL